MNLTRASQDFLLDGWSTERTTLYAAQTLLLDVFALLDDLDLARPLLVEEAVRVDSTKEAVRDFLERHPWVPAPAEA